MSVPDSTAERILQAVRAWLKLAASRTPLTNAQVRVANEPGPRLDGPYLTVRVLADDILTGTDYPIDLQADRVTVTLDEAGGPYEVTVNGTLYSVSSGGDDTAATVAAALATAINADEDLYAVASGATVTIGGALASPETSVGSFLTLEAGAIPATVIVAHRSATVSIQGYGRETLAWLERAFQRIEAPEVRALNAAAGISIRANGGLTDLAALLDTTFEHRYGRDVTVVYKRHEDPSFGTAATSVEVDATYQGDPADRDDEVVVDIAD